MRRLIAAVLATLCVLNGSMMLCASPTWYARVPGASETGPYNAHFVEDIGAAFFISGLALAARAWRPVYWPAAVAGASFLAIHSLIHLVEISFALLLALDRLSPLERAAFLLHDVFDLQFSEVARMIDRTEAACRQLATRARRAVRDARPAPSTTPDSHARLLSAFSEAVASGDVSRLAGLLREDAIAMADGGGRKTAAFNPIKGADKIARFFISLAAKSADHDIRIEPTMINGTVGALLYVDGEIDHSLSMAIDGERIAAIYIVRNPDKLRHVPAVTRQ